MYTCMYACNLTSICPTPHLPVSFSQRGAAGPLRRGARHCALQLPLPGECPLPCAGSIAIYV